MATTEIFAIVGVIVAAALILPILLDENPGAFLENGLCTIFTPGSGTNTTCNAIKGNVTFVGVNPISIQANNSANTITWSVGQGNGTSHANIGGGAEVFKNETGFASNWRTLEGGGGVSVTQNAETITIETGGGGAAIQDICTVNANNQGNAQGGPNLNGTFVCDENDDTIEITVVDPITISNVTGGLEIIFEQCTDPQEQERFLYWNYTTGTWSCVDGGAFASGGLLNNNENFYPHLCAGTASDPIIPFTSYSIRAVEMDKPKDCNFAFPAPKTEPENVKIEIWWFKDTSAAGTVCFETSVMPIQIGDDVDGTFGNQQKVCEVFGVGGVDELRVMQINYTNFVSPLPPGETADIIVVKLDRLNEAPDDYVDPAWIMMARVTWQD